MDRPSSDGGIWGEEGVEREQYISLRLWGRADDQSNFMVQKRSAFYKVGTLTGANVRFGTSCPTQCAAAGNRLR